MALSDSRKHWFERGKFIFKVSARYACERRGNALGREDGLGTPLVTLRVSSNAWA